MTGTIIENGKNEIFISAVTGWGIIIKFQLGRLILPGDPESYLMEQIQRNAFQPLPIQMRHSLHLLALPSFHKDPFDRMLIAQAKLEHLPILTSDDQISRYPVEVIWA